MRQFIVGDRVRVIDYPEGDFFTDLKEKEYIVGRVGKVTRDNLPYIEVLIDDDDGSISDNGIWLFKDHELEAE